MNTLVNNNIFIAPSLNLLLLSIINNPTNPTKVVIHVWNLNFVLIAENHYI